MPEEGLVLGLLCAAVALILPIVALVFASRATREAATLRVEISRLRASLNALGQRVAAWENTAGRQAPSPFRSPGSVGIPDFTPAGDLAQRTVAPDEPSAVDASSASETPVDATAGLQPVPPGTAAGPLAPVTVFSAAEPPVADPPLSTTAAPALGEPRADTDEPAGSLEERIGVLWFTRIGAAVLVLGAAYFFKYSVDNNWLGPVHRVILGTAAGLGVLAFAERIRARTRKLYVQILLGIGVSLLYVCGYATYGFYRLVPQTAAFVALAGVSLLAGALSVRHRAEPILIVALSAALANPIVLSSGSDNAAGLAAYVLLVTTAALAVAVHQRFALAAGLALLGTTVVAAGWYMRFFVGSATGSDAPYGTLAARVVPLAALGAFVAQWAWLGLRARAIAWSQVGTSAVLAAAVVAAHVGALALLFDQPVALAWAAVAAALATAELFRRTRGTTLVGVALALSFLALGVAAHGARGAPPGVMLAGLVWLAIHAGGLVAALRTDRARPELRTLAALALQMAMVLAAIALLPADPRTLAAVLVVLAAALAALASWTQARGGAVVGAFVAMACLLVAEPPGPGRDGVALALAGAVGAVYLAEAVHHLLARRGPATALAGASMLVGPLGFVAVTLAHTGPADDAARGLAAAGAALAVSVPGALLWRRRTDARGVANAALATGVALVLAALATQLPGVSVTLAWAGVGLAVAWLAAASDDRHWMLGAVLIFALALLRVVFRDLAVMEQHRAEFESSLGQRGELFPAAFTNVRAVALAGVGAALLGSGFALRKAAPGTERRVVSAAFATVGYAVLITNAVMEVRGLLTAYPALPGGPLDPIQFRQYLAAVDLAVEAERGPRAVGATLVLGVAGIALLAGGFAARSLLHRWLGLIVLSGTVLKLVLWDVWNLTRLQQVMVLVGVGVLLLGAGYLYARLGSRLLRMLKSPPRPA